MTHVRARAPARVALAGNPSDGYGGATLALAIANFAAEVTVRDADRLDLVSGPLGRTSFTSLGELVSRMFRLIEYSSQVLGSKQNDPETVAELYYKISNDYFDSPDLRVQWLENLCEFQLSVRRSLFSAEHIFLKEIGLFIEY